MKKRIPPFLLLLALLAAAALAVSACGAPAAQDRTTEASSATAAPAETTAPAPTETTTLLIYMIGSDLEAKTGAGTNDLEEIRLSGVDLQHNNILVCAGGTVVWHNDFVSAGQNTLLRLTEAGWEQAAAYEKQSMGESACLTRFLTDGCALCPADRYALILWDHGNGPVVGYGKDFAFEGDRLTLPELRDALAGSPFAGDRRLDWIGFDACLMSSAELAAVCSPYTDLLAASEETEPCLGWDYGFLSRLGRCEPKELLCSMADDYLAACLAYYESKGYAGGDVTLAVLDLTCADRLSRAVNELFAAAEPDTVLAFDRLAAGRAGVRSVARASTGSEYDLVDLRDLASAMEKDYPEQAKALLAAADETVIHFATNAEGLSGLSLYYPFYNKPYYTKGWAEDYRAVGVFGEYLSYLERYAANWLYEGSPADYTHPVTPEQAGDGLFTLRLSEEEAAQFAAARYYVLYREGEELYRLVFTGTGVTNDNGLLTAAFDGNIIYGLTDHGELFRPVTLQRDTVGSKTHYTVDVFLENFEPEFTFSHCFYHIVLDRDTGAVEIRTLLPEDEQAESDGVIGGKAEEPDLSEWSRLLFNEFWHETMTRYDNGVLQGWESWTRLNPFSAWEFPASEGIGFVYAPICYGDYVLVFEITDTHGDRWCSEPLPLHGETKPLEIRPKIPAPDPVRVEWDGREETAIFENDALRISIRTGIDAFGSEGMYLVTENRSDRDLRFDRTSDWVINGSVQARIYSLAGTLGAGQTEESEIIFSELTTYGLLQRLESMSFGFDLTWADTGEYLFRGQQVEIVCTDSEAVPLDIRYGPQLEPFRGAAAGEQILCDNDDCLVRLVSLGSDAVSSDTLMAIIYVENRTDHYLCLACDGFALNGVFAQGTMEQLILEPGRSAWCFPRASMYDSPVSNQIPEVAQAQLCLRMSRNNQTLWLGDGTPEWYPIRLDQKAAAAAPFVPGGETVYEENGLRLALRSEEMGGACVQEDSKQCWFLTVENNTDRGIRLAAAEQSVNGAAVPYGFSFEHAALGPGQRTVLRIELSYYGSQPPATRESPAERIGFVLKVMNFTNTAELWRSDAPLELVFQ